MTEVKLPKYRTVTGRSAAEFDERINALADLGYTVKLMAVSDHADTSLLYAIMTLGEENYENVTNLRDIAPELVDSAIESGWTPGSLSLSTKFVRMIRRKKL